MTTIRNYVYLGIERLIFMKHRRSANRALKRGLWKRAVRRFEYIRSRTGGRLGIGSSIRLARAYEKLGCRRQAYDVLSGALRSFPGEPRILEILLEMEVDAGNWQNAGRYWDGRFAAARLTARSYANIIRMFRRTSRSEDAIKAAGEGLSTHPGNGEILAALQEIIPARRHVYVIIRHSILTIPGRKRWRVGRNVDVEAYRRKLFDPSRLSARQRLFRHITLPSLAAQDLPEPGAMTLLVLTSRSLPRPNRAELDDTVKPHPWIQVYGLSEKKNVLEQLRAILEADLKEKATDGPVAYATAWLDDDDALARGYVKELYRYVDPALSGYCVTFPKGYHGVWDETDRRFSLLHTCYKPNIALGLSQINTYDPATGFLNPACSVYHVRKMGHKYIDRSAPTIKDARMPMYFRTHHAASDLFRTRSPVRMRRYFRSLGSIPQEWDAVAAAIEIDRNGLEALNGQVPSARRETMRGLSP